MTPGAVAGPRAAVRARASPLGASSPARLVDVAARRARRPSSRRDRRAVTTRARIGGVLDVAKVGEVAGNAAAAAVEVSKAVRMRGVEAPDDMAKSYVAKGTAAADANGGPVAIDEDGLPLVYDKAAIQAFAQFSTLALYAAADWGAGDWGAAIPALEISTVLLIVAAVFTAYSGFDYVRSFLVAANNRH